MQSSSAVIAKWPQSCVKKLYYYILLKDFMRPKFRAIGFSEKTGQYEPGLMLI